MGKDLQPRNQVNVQPLFTREATFVTFCFLSCTQSPFWQQSTLEEKKCLPMGIIFCLLETPFGEQIQNGVTSLSWKVYSFPFRLSLGKQSKDRSDATECFACGTILIYTVCSGPMVIKAFFMLNSAEYTIRPASKSQITNKCILFLRNIAEHDNFSANEYENAKYCWHFHIHKQRKFHAQLN